MKQFKNQKISIYILAIFSIIMLQSCNKSDDLTSSSEKKISMKNMEYLDADTSNFSNPTEQQQETIKKAMARIDSFVVCENKTFRFTINSGSEIQISERLFEFFKSRMEQSNAIVKNLNVVADFYDPNKLHLVSSTTLNNKIRLKTSANEAIPSNQNGIDYTWCGVDIYLTQKSLNSLSNACYAGASASGLAALYLAKTGVEQGAIGATAAASLLGIGGAGFSELSNQFPRGCVISLSYISMPPFVLITGFRSR